MKCYVHPDIDAVGTCTNCGKTVCPICATEVNGKIVCKQCTEKMACAQASPPGVSAGAATARTLKDPMIAAVLALLGIITVWATGLGPIYNGQVKKGICISLLSLVLIFIGVIIYIITCFTIIGIYCCWPIILILPWILVIWNAYDSYKTAMSINVGEPVKDWFD